MCHFSFLKVWANALIMINDMEQDGQKEYKLV